MPDSRLPTKPGELEMYAQLAERLAVNLSGLALEANAIAIQLRAVERRALRKRLWWRRLRG